MDSGQAKTEKNRSENSSMIAVAAAAGEQQQN